MTYKKLEKPTVLQFPINDKCDSKCQMCNIWENKESNDINPLMLKKGLSSDLFSNVKSVGINGGEPTLRDDMVDLVDSMLTSLPRLEQLSLITNGYKTQRVVDRIESVGQLAQKYGVKVDVMVSLDGYAEVHDKVRRRTDFFSRATQTLLALKNSQYVDSVRVGCTVIQENVNYLQDLLDFCIRHGIYIKFRLGIPHKRLYTEDKNDTYLASAADKYEFAEFLQNLLIHYERNTQQRTFYQSLIGQLVLGKEREAGCLWQHKGATLTHDGKLLYCAVKSDVIHQDITQGDPSGSYFGAESSLHHIIDNECSSCHHDYVGELNKHNQYIAKIRKTSWYRKSQKSFAQIELFRAMYHHIKYAVRYKKANKINCEDEVDILQPSILICGWYGTETLGDKAILGGIIASIKRSALNNHNVYLCSLNPYLSQQTVRQMPELSSVSVLNVAQAIYNLKAGGFSHLLFGGGPIMTTPPIVEMSLLFDLAKKAKIRTIVAGCGVGPLGDPQLVPFLTNILKKSDVRIFRDNESLVNAQKLTSEYTTDLVTNDPAFTWLTLNKAISVRTSRKNEQKVLLLGLRDIPFKEYAHGLDSVSAQRIKYQFEMNIIKALLVLCEQIPELKILPVPMCTNHFGADDRWYYRNLFRGNQRLLANTDMKFLNNELAPNEYLKAFQLSDVCLTMRFHALVFGLAANKNCVVLDYTFGKGKVKSLADKYRQPISNVADVKSDWIVEQVQFALNGQLEVNVKSATDTFSDVLSRSLDDSIRA